MKRNPGINNLKRYPTQPTIVSPGRMQRRNYQSPTGVKRYANPSGINRNISPPGVKRNINQQSPRRNLNPRKFGSQERYPHYRPKPLPARQPTFDHTKNKKGIQYPVYNFTPQEIEKLRHGFNEIDLDGNGRLDKYEMNTFLQKNGLDVTFTDLEYQLFSHDGETLDFEEFKTYMSITSQMETNPRIYYKCLFDFIDKDHSGGIDQNELMEFCKLVKSPITLAEAKKTIKELDDTHTGTINFNELCKYLGV